MKRQVRWLCVMVCVACHVRAAAAQGVTPPRILALHPIVSDAKRHFDAEYLTAVVLVTSDGHGELVSCEGGAAAQAAIVDALARSTFIAGSDSSGSIQARVTVRFPVVQSLVPPEAAPVAPTATIDAVPRADDESGADATSAAFAAEARVRRTDPAAERMPLAETRDAPGSFGDPFRAIESLPGVTMVMSGLPYFDVRGAPVGGGAYYFEDMRLPTLFHLGLGPAVIHPRFVGDLDFYPGYAPARFGRFTGGVIDAHVPDAATRDASTQGELELRLVDAQAYVRGPVGSGVVTLAGRYGYPGPIVGLLSDTELAYSDYQAQFVLPFDDADAAVLTAFGAYDIVGTKGEPEDEMQQQFHRLELKVMRELSDTSAGAALQVGYERSRLGQQFEVELVRLGPRIWIATKLPRRGSWSFGADLSGTAGSLDAPRDRDRQRPLAQILDNPVYRDVAARSVTGGYGELRIWPLDRLRLDLGVRADLWLTGTEREAAVEPRALAYFDAADGVDVHVAAGIAHQPATYPITLPGVSDVAVDGGLQTSLQSEAGVGVELGDRTRASVNGYLHRYEDTVYFRKLIDCDSGDVMGSEAGSAGAAQTTRLGGPPADSECADPGLPRASATAYGAELLIKRSAGSWLSGWLSYTLAWAHARTALGVEFIPAYDVRHTLNLVSVFELGAGFNVGAKLTGHSGRVLEDFVRDTQELERPRRLPAFFRVDLESSYRWTTSWGAMRLSLEWYNASFSREATGTTCEVDRDGNPVCEVERAPLITVPILGLRATF